MNRSEQISDWYKNLTRVSKDDKADYEVMLMDKENTDDAVAAITGMLLNLLQGTYKEDVLLLMIDGTRRENALLVQYHSMVEVLQMCLLYDKQIRRSRDVQEALLNMLEHQQSMAIELLHKMFVLNKKLLSNLVSQDLHSSLIYRLVVVGERQQAQFN